MNFRYYVLLILLVVFSPSRGLTADENSMTGTWIWNFTMPDGTSVRSRLRLRQEGSTLTGVSLIRAGTEAAITNASVSGNKVQFEVIRHRFGVETITRYQGTRDGEQIGGTVESNWAGSVATYPWIARRQPSINGTWKWTADFNGRPVEVRLRLKLDEDRLTGEIPFGRRPIPITKGVFKDGAVSFEVKISRGTFRSHQIFVGKLEGDSIIGTTELTLGDDEPRTEEWEAHRAE